MLTHGRNRPDMSTTFKLQCSNHRMHVHVYCHALELPSSTAAYKQLQLTTVSGLRFSCGMHRFSCATHLNGI
jgi:hypothetical protein